MNIFRKNKAILPIAGCLVVQLCVGILYLWSVFKSPIVAAYGWSGDSARMVSSYMLIAFVTGSFLGGILNDKKGPKLTCFLGVVLFSLGVGMTALLNSETIGLINLTYAAVGGLGSGFAYSACISCVQKWLPDHRGLASGLAVSAFGLSTVVFAPVSKLLMGIFTDEMTGLVNFQPVFLILALVFLVLGIGGCLFIRLPENVTEKKAVKVATNDMTLSQAVKTVPFWCLFFSIFFINGTWNLAVPLIYDLGVERGLSAALATFCVSFTGIPNAAGRLIMAAASDKLGRRNTISVLSLVTLLAAIAMIYAKGIGFIVVVAVIAFAYGGPSSVNAAFSTDYFGAKNSGTNYGVIMLALGLSSLFFNAVSAKLLGGDIQATFVMAAFTAAVPVILMYILRKHPVAVPVTMPAPHPVPAGGRQALGTRHH